MKAYWLRKKSDAIGVSHQTLSKSPMSVGIKRQPLDRIRRHSMRLDLFGKSSF